MSQAPPGLRASCLAAFDLDPSKKNSLTFGARNYRQLRVTYSDGIASSSSSLVPLDEDSADVLKTMETAQLEAFDEELFAEVSRLFSVILS